MDFTRLLANGTQVWLVASVKLPLTLMRVMNINNLNSERIMKDKQYLYNWYNATSTDDGTGEIETYENWLERQLISRIEKLETLEKANEQHSEHRQLTIPDVSVSVCYNRDCFYYDKTDNTCVGNYKACTVKQTER